MFLFIATIFIAELIIALTLIAYIIKADSAVVDLYKQSVAAKQQIKSALAGVKEGIKEVNKKKEIAINFLRKQRNRLIINSLVTVTIYLLLLVFKNRCKKASAICRGLLLVKDVWDSIPA